MPAADPDLPPDVAAEWLETASVVMHDYRLMCSIFIASLAIILYDYFLTFDDEVAYIWLRKKTWTSSLFFVNRYWPISYIIFDVIVLTGVKSPSTKFCNVWFWIIGYTQEISHISVQVILILRIYAMYFQDRLLLIFMCAFLTCEIIIEMVIVGILVHNLTLISVPDLNLGCLPTNNTTWFWAFWVPVLTFETILFFLSIFKSMQLALRDTRTPNIMAVLLRDSIVYFGGVLAIILTNFVIWVTAKGPLWLVFILTPSVIHSILGCRMLLNIRKASEPQYMQQYLTNLQAGHDITTLALPGAGAEPGPWLQLDVFREYSSKDLESVEVSSA